jgi:hypothetical protein
MQSYIYSANLKTFSAPERYFVASQSYVDIYYGGTHTRQVTQNGDGETEINRRSYDIESFKFVNGNTRNCRKEGCTYSAEWWEYQWLLTPRWSYKTSSSSTPAATTPTSQFSRSLEVPCGTETYNTYTESSYDYVWDDEYGDNVPTEVTHTGTVYSGKRISTTTTTRFPTKYNTTIVNGVTTISAVSYQTTSHFTAIDTYVTSTATRVATSKLQWMQSPSDAVLVTGAYTIRYQADEGEMLCVGSYAASDYSTHLYYDVTYQDSFIKSDFTWGGSATNTDLGEWTVSSSSSQWEALSYKGFYASSNNKTRTVNVRSANSSGVSLWIATTSTRMDNVGFEWVTTTTSSSWNFGGGFANAPDRSGFTWASPVVTHQMTSKKVIDRIVGVVSNPPFKTYSVLNVNSSWNRPSLYTFTEEVVLTGAWGDGTERHYRIVAPGFVISEVGVTSNDKVQFLQKKVVYSDLHDHWAAANRTNEAKSFRHSAMFENYPEWVVEDNHAIVPILHFEKDITYAVTSHSNANSNSRTTVWRASIDGSNTTVSRTTFNSSTSASYSESITYTPLDNATTADVYDVAGVAGGYCNGEPITVVCKSGGAYRVTKGNTNPSASASTFITTWSAGDIVDNGGVCIVATPIAFLGESMGNGSGSVIGAGAFLDRN